MKISCISILITLLFLSRTDAQILKLPTQSNIYPDTFAIYWNDVVANRSGKLRATIKIQSMQGDQLLDPVIAADTLTIFPFASALGSESAIIINTNFFTESGDRAKILPSESQLVVLATDLTVQGLIKRLETTPSMENLVRLADAYERLSCFVNVFYVCRRMQTFDKKAARIYWDSFCHRHQVSQWQRHGVHR